MSSSVIKLAKEILGRTPPMDLRETVDVVARVCSVVYFAYQTVPWYVSNNKLEARVQQLRKNLDTERSTPLENSQ